MKYAGKMDIARNVNSVLLVGGSNKSVQQMDDTTNRSELMKDSVEDQGVTACKMRLYQVCELRE